MGIVLNYLSLRGYFGSYDEFVFGGILIVGIMFLPEGLVGGARRLVRVLKRRLARSEAGRV